MGLAAQICYHPQPLSHEERQRLLKPKRGQYLQQGNKYVDLKFFLPSDSLPEFPNGGTQMESKDYGSPYDRVPLCQSPGAGSNVEKEEECFWTSNWKK